MVFPLFFYLRRVTQTTYAAGNGLVAKLLQGKSM
jgi:hypothetical protein